MDESPGPLLVYGEDSQTRGSDFESRANQMFENKTLNLAFGMVTYCLFETCMLLAEVRVLEHW